MAARGNGRCAYLRRTEASELSGVRRFDGLSIDPDSREVHVGGEPVPVTKLELDLLERLSSE